jgi:hypothetical protein
MASERELIESTPGDERDIRRGADGSLTAQIDRQRRVTRVLAGFALLITLAGGAAVVGTSGYLVSRTSASGADSRVLDRQIAEARENLATAATPAKAVGA